MISPLIALMKDQVDGLRANGIAADFLNSTLDNRTAAKVERDAQAGAVRLLYAAPERVSMPGFQRFLSTLDLRMIAIDEAHCISEWGHDFRPDYRALAELRDLFPQTPIMALTATATERVQRDIVEQLRLNDCRRFVSGFDRPNLTYRVRPGAGAGEALLDLLEERKGQSAIVYCFFAQGHRGTGGPAHQQQSSGGGLPRGIGLQHATSDAGTVSSTVDVPIVAATIAFGMGIDKPDIRLVVHHTLPKSIEGYYQETGRAGRDGLPSDCVLFFNEGDRAKQEYFIQAMRGDAPGRRRNATAADGRLLPAYDLPPQVSAAIFRRHCGRRFLRRLRHVPGGTSNGGRHRGRTEAAIGGDPHRGAFRYRARLRRFCWERKSSESANWNTTS